MRISDWSSDVCSSDLWVMCMGVVMLVDPAARLEKSERTTAAASGRAGQTGAGARLAVWALGSDSLHASAGPDPARPGPIRARGRAANQPVATRNLSWA